MLIKEKPEQTAFQDKRRKDGNILCSNGKGIAMMLTPEELAMVRNGATDFHSYPCNSCLVTLGLQAD